MYNNILIIFFISLFAASCTERIDINTDDAPPQLAIYGHITSDTMQHAISVTRSSGYFATSKPQGLSHATVTISSGDQIFTLTESATEAGLYQTDVDAFGIEGRTYTLNVSLDFDNDGQAEQYQSTSYLPFAARFDSLALRQSPDYKDYVEAAVWAKMSPDKDCYYSFHGWRNEVALSDSLIRFNMADGKLVGVDDLNDVSCFFMNQKEERQKLAPGDKFTLRVDVLTREYGIFLMNAQGELQGASPFSGPPANVETNIKCVGGSAPAGVSGYFSAYSSRKRSTLW